MTTNDDISYTTNNMNASYEIDPTLIFGPQRDSLYIVITITIIYSIIFITGVFGNTITCIVITQNKNMHTATNFYLFSLSMSDLLLLISGMPQEIYSIWIKWPYIFGNTFCIFRGLAAETSTNASVLTITLFTMERYLAICHPFVSYQMSTLSRAVKHVLLLWAVSLGVALPQALQFGIIVHKGVTMCLQTRVIIPHSFEISTLIFFFVPIIIIIVFYSLIGLRLYRSSIGLDNVEGYELKRNIIQPLPVHSKKSSTQSTKRVIQMLIAVVAAFFICWAPFHAQRLVAIYSATDNHLAKSPTLQSVYTFMTYTSGVFYYMSTCINPILYHIMSNKFREAFKNTMSQWLCQNTSQPIVQRCSYTTVQVSRNVDRDPSTNSGNSFKKEKIKLKTLKPCSKKQDRLNVSPTGDEKIFQKCKATSAASTQQYDPRSFAHQVHTSITLPDTQIPVN